MKQTVLRLVIVAVGGVVGVAIASWIRLSNQDARAAATPPVPVDREMMIRNVEGWLNVFGLLIGLAIGAFAVCCLERCPRIL